jgi:hypothetical protein
MSQKISKANTLILDLSSSGLMDHGSNQARHIARSMGRENLILKYNFLWRDRSCSCHQVRFKGNDMKMHVAGEDSVRQALNIYERVRRGNHNGPRHEIVYFNAIHKGQFIPITSWGEKSSLRSPGLANALCLNTLI